MILYAIYFSMFIFAALISISKEDTVLFILIISMAVMGLTLVMAANTKHSTELDEVIKRMNQAKADAEKPAEAQLRRVKKC